MCGYEIDKALKADKNKKRAAPCIICAHLHNDFFSPPPPTPRQVDKRRTEAPTMAGASAVLALEEREAMERARLEALFKQLGLRKHCCDDGEPADGTCTCVYARCGGLFGMHACWPGLTRSMTPQPNNTTGTAVAPWWRTALAGLVLLALGVGFFGVTLYVPPHAHVHMHPPTHPSYHHLTNTPPPKHKKPATPSCSPSSCHPPPPHPPPRSSTSFARTVFTACSSPGRSPPRSCCCTSTGSASSSTGRTDFDGWFWGGRRRC